MSGGLTTNSQTTRGFMSEPKNREYTHSLEEIEFEYGSLSEMSDAEKAMIEFEYGAPKYYEDWERNIDSPEETPIAEPQA